MTTPQRRVLLEALDLYCEWLNLWTAVDPEPRHTYKPEQFLKWKPEDHLYGANECWGEIKGVEPFGYNVYCFEVSDGDDGGPSVLTVHTDTRPPFTIAHIVQDFDSLLQSIYDASDHPARFYNTPIGTKALDK